MHQSAPYLKIFPGKHNYAPNSNSIRYYFYIRIATLFSKNLLKHTPNASIVKCFRKFLNIITYLPPSKCVANFFIFLYKNGNF